MTNAIAANTLPPPGVSWVEFVAGLAPELLPRHNDEYPGGNVVVIGSFKGLETEIVPTRERLRAAGFFPLAPHGERITHYVGADGTFEVVDADAVSIRLMEERLGRVLTKIETAELLEALFCAAIKESDFVYVAGLPRDDIDDGDYIGNQVATEFGYALGGGPVYGTKISPSLDARDGYDYHFPLYVSLIQVATPEELGERYANGVVL